VRKAYKQKALETHPDKLDLANDEEKQAAEARFHEVCEAFEVLSDPRRRRAYDVQIRVTSGWTGFSEEQEARMRDRQEWAQKRKEEFQARLAALRRMQQLNVEEMRRREQEMAEYKKMVQTMLSELGKEIDGWDERKARAQRFKADAKQTDVPLPS